jgi:hypothetical protein
MVCMDLGVHLQLGHLPKHNRSSSDFTHLTITELEIYLEDHLVKFEQLPENK